ncbi:nitrate ABC transporter substrate-bindingprotein [Pseudomonas sp. TCU-HL1]|nr:nitrate ABC transporter substrate-bindingprotein [Pseudomonas sp. TCU-HL1]
MRLRATVAGLALAISSLSASAETIRIAIGTQDTTINCATGGLLISVLSGSTRRSDQDELSAFLLKSQAEQYAQQHGGTALHFVSANQKLVAQR